MRVARPVRLTPEQQKQLQAAAEGRRVSVRLAERASIVLLAAQGLQDKQIGTRLGIDRITAAHWRNRYLEQGYDGLVKDAPRSGRPRTVTALKVKQIVQRTTQTKKKPHIDPDIRRFVTDLAEKLGAPVRVEHGEKGKGRLVIHYNSLDELEGILKHIK